MNDHAYTYAEHAKKKGKKSSLQFLFSDLAHDTANDKTVHHLPDRRNVGVETKKEKAMTRAEAAEQAARNGADRDGLLGSLLLEHFLSAALCPLLPLALQSVDISNLADAADEFWMDRRAANQKAAKTDEEKGTYFPSYFSGYYPSYRLA